jgi:hypothetical protein
MSWLAAVAINGMSDESYAVFMKSSAAGARACCRQRAATLTDAGAPERPVTGLRRPLVKQVL